MAADARRAGRAGPALGIESDEAFDALARARDIRDRYTVLDLAFELGFFPGGIRQVILTAGV